MRAGPVCATLACVVWMSCGGSPDGKVTVPGPPTAVDAAPGDSSATVRWQPPGSNGGAAISSNTVASAAGPIQITVPGDSTSATVGNLSNGTSYVFTVAATNSAGNGPASAPSNAVVPFGKPGVPAISSATPGDRSVTVTWSAADPNGSPINTYTIAATPGPVTITVAGGLTSAVVTGLTNGTAYTFTVTAANAAGSGLASAPSSAVTPRGLPGAPPTVTATPQDGQVLVGWTAAQGNGASIQSYTVTWTPGGGSFTTADGTTASTTISGLTNGTAYTFSVFATNAAGNGPATSAAAVTPFGKPGAPTITGVTAGDRQVTVSWSAPSSNNGSPILDYTVTSNPGGFTATVTSTTAIVTGLTNGTSYTFTVTARNLAGSSSPSGPSAAVTPFGLPGAPTISSATAGNGQVTVTWTAASPNGSAIQFYRVIPSPSGTAVQTPDGNTTSAIVTGLTNGSTYTFTVVAKNAAGLGQASAPSAAVTPSTIPAPPTNVVASPGNLQAQVSWTLPVTDGGSAITSYRAVASPGGASATVGGAAATSVTVPGLANGTAYTFVVFAHNANGDSVASAASNAVTPAAVPGAPTGVAATPGDTKATVSWTPPASNGSPITSYTITATPVVGTTLFPVSVAPGGKYLLDSQLRPLPILGRTAWFILSAPTADFQHFVDDTAAKGYDAIEFHVINHDARGNNPPFDGNGNLPFTTRLDGTAWTGALSPFGNPAAESPDFTKTNEAYWLQVDALLSYCASKGILVFLFPAYTGYNGGPQGWMQEMVANGVANMQTYGNWIAARYKNQKNIVWMMGGDFGTANAFSTAQSNAEAALIAGLQSAGETPPKLMSAEWSTESVCTDQGTFGSNCTLNGSYSFSGDVANQSRRAYQAANMPAFLLEEPYDEEGPDGTGVNPSATQPVRRFQWWGWLSSIGGYISGNGYIWPFAPSIWPNHLDTPGTLDMRRLNALVASIAWWKLVPSGIAPMGTLVTSGGSTVGQPDYVAAAASPDGTLLVAYVPPASGGTFTVNMTVMAGAARALWFDPTSGLESADSGSPVANTGTHQFTVPGTNSAGARDWVLLLQSP